MPAIAVIKAVANDSAITYYSTGAANLSQGTLVSVTGIGSDGGSTWFNRSNVRITSATKTTFTVDFTNGPQVPITGVSFAGSGSGESATYTTSRAHEFQVGDRVTVSGLAPDVLNLDPAGVAITSVTDTTFTVPSSAPTDSQIDAANSMDEAANLILNNPVTNVVLTGTGANEIATYTTLEPHGLSVNDLVAVNGLSPASANILGNKAKAILSVPTSTTFTVSSSVTARGFTFNRTASAFSSVYLPASLTSNPAGSAAAAFSWNNFHVVPSAGLFETYHREYQSGYDTIYTASPSQHSVAYAAVDPTNSANSLKSVTFRYSGPGSQVGKKIAFKFFALSGRDQSDISSHFSTTDGGAEHILTVVSDGHSGAKAEFTVTRDDTPFADADGNGDILNAGFVAGNSILSDLAVHWERLGFGPIVKLVGTSYSPLGNCDPATSGLTIRLCSQTGFRDETFDWSVANRAWFQQDNQFDYSQAWAKSYAAGETLDLKFHVIDIWGNPIAGHNVQFNITGGKDLKWAKDSIKTATNSDGYVTFVTRNLNTAKQVNAHVDYNPDTGQATVGILSFQPQVALVPANPGPECDDLMWFQMHGGAPIADASATFKLQRIGSVNFAPVLPSALSSIATTDTTSDSTPVTAVSGNGTLMTYTAVNDFTVGESVAVRGNVPSALNTTTAGLVVTEATPTSFTLACSQAMSPCNATTATTFGKAMRAGAAVPTALALDIDGTSRTDVISGQFNLLSPINTFSYVGLRKRKINQAQLLYDPNVTVTATNGGLSAVVNPAQKLAGYTDFTDSSSFSSKLVFGAPCYSGVCIQDLAFMATKPGDTTWTIALGAWKRTFTMHYGDLPDASRARSVIATSSNIIAIPNVTQTSSFTVVDRNGNAYANRNVTVSVSGVGTLTSAAQVTTDLNGRVTVTTTSATAGDQIVTVTADTNGTQMADGSYSRFNATLGATVTIPAGSSSASTTIHFGRILVNSVAAKKAGATIEVWNASGKTLSVKIDGKKVFTKKLSKAKQSVVVPLVKGAHTLVITIPGMTPSQTVKVTAS